MWMKTRLAAPLTRTERANSSSWRSGMSSVGSADRHLHRRPRAPQVLLVVWPAPIELGSSSSLHQPLCREPIERSCHLALDLGQHVLPWSRQTKHVSLSTRPRVHEASSGTNGHTRPVRSPLMNNMSGHMRIMATTSENAPNTTQKGSRTAAPPKQWEGK